MIRMTTKRLLKIPANLKKFNNPLEQYWLSHMDKYEDKVLVEKETQTKDVSNVTNNSDKS